MTLGQSFRERYLDVLASVYLYNEHRGYTSLDRVLAAARAPARTTSSSLAKWPGIAPRSASTT